MAAIGYTEHAGTTATPSSENSMAEPDTELFDQAIKGDTAALRTLLTRYGPAARKAIQGKIGRKWRSVLEEDDVMQVTYLEAFLHIDHLIGRNPASFVAWLRKIAENVLRDAIRELERKKRPNPAKRLQTAVTGESYATLLDYVGGTSTTPSRHARRNESREILEHAMQQLPPDYRDVLQLHHLEGRSVAEVATKMSRSQGAVYMIRARALERLRSLLGAESKFFTDPA